MWTSRIQTIQPRNDSCSCPWAVLDRVLVYYCVVSVDDGVSCDMVRMAIELKLASWSRQQQPPVIGCVCVHPNYESRDQVGFMFLKHVYIRHIPTKHTHIHIEYKYKRSDVSGWICFSLFRCVRNVRFGIIWLVSMMRL